MKQESSHESRELRRILQEELRQIGGLPVKHDKYFRDVFKNVEFAKAFLRYTKNGKKTDVFEQQPRT